MYAVGSQLERRVSPLLNEGEDYGRGCPHLLEDAQR